MSEVRLIQSIERATAILEIIAQEGGAARLQHIAEHTKLGKTTAHNLLKTLDELGYVHRRAGDTRYHLGGRILNLARIAGDDGASQPTAPGARSRRKAHRRDGLCRRTER